MQCVFCAIDEKNEFLSEESSKLIINDCNTIKECMTQLCWVKFNL